MIKGDIAATRPVAARLPKVAPEQLEASSLPLVKDMNRAGLTSFGVAGCNADVLEIFQKWKAQDRLQRPRLLHRRRRGRHARAGGPLHPADRAR